MQLSMMSVICSLVVVVEACKENLKWLIALRVTKTQRNRQAFYIFFKNGKGPSGYIALGRQSGEEPRSIAGQLPRFGSARIWSRTQFGEPERKKEEIT
jgi:hypothetical protein